MAKPAIDTDDKLDLLWGVPSIAEFLGLEERQVYYALSQAHLPGRKIGSTWTATRSELRRAVTSGEAA